MAERDFETPRLDAELLVGHALDLERLQLYLNFDRPVDEPERAAVRGLLRERARGVPVAYLVGRREFFSLAFEVGPGVLVPRPETEHLVETALAFLKPLETPVFADVGCGSGCVAVSVLHHLPGARAFATDVSSRAVAVTRANAERHGVADRLTVLEGDLLGPVSARAAPGALDAVLSNPPYIVVSDETVEEGVRRHEPAEALFVPDEDALHFVRRLAGDARALLRSGGLLAIEVGAGSAEEARRVLAGAGYGGLEVVPDLAGIDRIVHGTR